MNLSSFLDIIFPPLCLSCRSYINDAKFICKACFGRIELNKTLFCGQCRNRLPLNRKICHKNFPYLLGAASEYRDEPVKNLIQGLKFRGLRRAAEPLAEIMINYAANLLAPAEKFLVIPVPLGPKRLKSRGFNQAELLARIFSERLNLALENGNLTRMKDSKPQSEIKDFFERRGSIRNVFSVLRPESIRNKNIILIDDVATSGATFLEAAQMLKKAGAGKIIALAAAKA